MKINKNDEPDIDLIASLARDNHISNVRKYSRGVVLFWLIAGIILGIWIHTGLTKPSSSGNTVNPAPTITVTVTKEVQIPTPVFPESCKRAVEIAVAMDANHKAIIAAGGKETDILKAARIAITARDMAQLTDAGTRNNQLQNDVSKATRELNEQYGHLKDALNACDKDLGR